MREIQGKSGAGQEKKKPQQPDRRYDQWQNDAEKKKQWAARLAYKARNPADSFVEFEDVNKIKKNAVRGLLKKRARRYDSESDGSEDSDGMPSFKRKKVVQKNSLADAFRSIMNKKLGDADEGLDHLGKLNPSASVPSKSQDFDADANVLSDDAVKPTVAKVEPILAKYKKRARDIEIQKVAEEKDRKKRILREKQRLMGRVFPTKADMERERELQIIATKGVVQLFNAVAEFQANLTKEALQEDKEKKAKASKMIQSVGADKNTGAANFNSMIEKINSTQRKWKVLDDEGESDAEGDDFEEINGIKIVNE